MPQAENPLINLVLLGECSLAFTWQLGSVFCTSKSPLAIHDLLTQHSNSRCDAWLFWDCELGMPKPDVIRATLSMPGDVWHAGLRLGLSGLPGLMDFVHPTWMLTRDPDSSKVATSWRLSLRACLIRASVLERLGGVCPDFKSLEGASLDMGHRYFVNGVITRHVPLLIDSNISCDIPLLPFADEWLFIFRRMARLWTYWSLGRALLSGYATPADVFAAFLKLRTMKLPTSPPIFPQTIRERTMDPQTRVSVIIPTLDRYDYIRKLLPQLKIQTVPPLEIIIIDQTPITKRSTTLPQEFPDLPLKLLYRDHPGQCSARNHGLSIAQGRYILFLDDDVEILPNLIEGHLRCLEYFRAPVSSGIADEVGAGELSLNFTYIRCSDVFPTNNTLIERCVLESSGLFDLAHDGGERDDADLGMRVYLAGHLMILNPNARILHHHAPRGGLRTQRSRVITYAKSRNNLLYRHLPSVSQMYLNKRYFTRRQIREANLLSLFGTLAFHGSAFGKIIKLLLGTLFLPHSLWRIYRNNQRANQLLKHYPQFPLLSQQNPRTEPVTSFP